MREVGYFVLCRGRARENAVRERGGVVYKQEQVSISKNLLLLFVIFLFLF